MEEHLRARRRGDLMRAADVVGVSVRAHDPRELVHPPSEAAQIRRDDPPGPPVPRVDQRELVLDDQVRLGAAEPEGVDVG